MSITDELRKYARPLHDVWYDPLSNVYTYTTTDIAPSLDAIRLDEHVLAIADRIDEEHEAALLNVHTDLMDASGWVRLPKDADGEYIHIGDRMENNERVARIVLTDDSWEPSVYLEKLPNVLHEYFCNEISHYHAPTVEDVLRECIANVCRSNAQLHEQGCPPLTIEDIDSELDEYINEYAAKLRLVGDAE